MVYGIFRFLTKYKRIELSLIYAPYWCCRQQVIKTEPWANYCFFINTQLMG